MIRHEYRARTRSRRIADAAAVDGHLDNLRLDARPISPVTVIEHKGLGRAIRVSTTIALDAMRT